MGYIDAPIIRLALQLDIDMVSFMLRVMQIGSHLKFLSLQIIRCFTEVKQLNGQIGRNYNPISCFA